MSKKQIFIAGLFALILLGIYFFNRGWDITNYPPKGDTVIAFGDSLVEGVGATKDNDFISLVSRQVGVPIENFGKSGDTTADALSRIGDPLAKNPDIAIILLGGNDALRRISMSETENNLREIIKSFQDAGSITLLLGVRGGLLGDPYDDMYERIAEDTGSVYVPNVLKGLFADSRYMSDAIHPNDLGYAKIAERVSKTLEKILSQ